MPQIQFAVQSYHLDAVQVSAQRTINCYAEREPPDAKTQVAVFNCPGLDRFATAGSGPARGDHVMGDVLYVVSGTTFYEVDADGTSHAKGTVAGTGMVSMDDNGTQICIVNGAQGYIFAPGGIVTTLAENALEGDTGVTLVLAGGVNIGDTVQIQLDDGSTFDTTVTAVAGTAIGIANALPSQASAGANFTDTQNSFQQITSAAFSPAKTVTFFDGYFIFDHVDTNQFFLSALFDGLTYSGLDFASAEVSSDFVVAVLNNQEQLYIFGESTIELWYDAGALDFPFQRYDGATIERGCIAALTPIREDNTVFFLGDDKIFYRLDGTTPMRISTHAIETTWESYETLSDAYTFSYTIEGHKLINLVFPTTQASWVYDIASGYWHERESWDANNISLKRWRGACYARCYGLDLICDAFDGSIGKVDFTTFTEYGNTMRAQMIGPPIHADRKRVFMSRFELDMRVGVGLTTGQGSDPQAMLDWSDDGGVTFKTRQPWRAMGRIGAYLTRLRWLQMGQFRQRVLRLNITDPVPRVVIAAHADITVGT